MAQKKLIVPSQIGADAFREFAVFDAQLRRERARDCRRGKRETV